IVNDQVIKTIGVSIPTDRWFFYAKRTTPGSLPIYINPKNGVKNGVLALNEEDLVSHQIDAQEDHNYIYTYFPGKLQVPSDNFRITAKVRLKNLNQNHSICARLMLEVFCQKNFMYFITTQPGC